MALPNCIRGNFNVCTPVRFGNFKFEAYYMNNGGTNNNNGEI